MNHQLDSKNTSKCCNAPTVICEGTEWDVKDVRGGSTYYYGCTKCKEACDIVQPPNTEDVMELDEILTKLDEYNLNADASSNIRFSVDEIYAYYPDLAHAKSKLTKYIEQEIKKARIDELRRMSIHRPILDREERIKELGGFND